MALRGTPALVMAAGLTLVMLTACERGTEPELEPAVLPQPATAATARAAMTASASALSDVAILAPRWRAMDFASTTDAPVPATLGTALWLAEASAWRVSVQSHYELDGVQRAMRGVALVQFLAGGTPQPLDTGANLMRIMLDLSTVEAQAKSAGVYPHLRLTGELTLDRRDEASPASLHGTGECNGFLEARHDDIVARTDVEVGWTVAVDAAYGACCPSGRVELAMAPFRTVMELGGQPLASGDFEHAGVPLARLQLALACAPQHAPRGATLRSPVALHAAASSTSQLQQLRSGLDGTPLLLEIGDAIALDGTVDERPIDTPPFIVGGDGMRLGDLTVFLQETLVRHGATAVQVALGSDGLLEVDHAAITGLSHASTSLRLSGNLSSFSDALGTHMESARPLLAVATEDDWLERLHSATEGADLNINQGNRIALTGVVNGIPITNQTFEVGTDGVTIGDLLEFVRDGLSASGATGVDATLQPDGSIRIANGSTAALGNIKLELGGSTNFNQVMLFGNLAAGGAGASAGRLLGPATRSDRLDALHNGHGRLLNLEFDPLSDQTVIQIGGTLGGEAITSRAMLVARGLTTLGDLLAELNLAFSISNADGVALTDEGLVDLRGDSGLENRIDNVSIQEPSNEVSNLATSFEFRTIEQAKDADSYTVTAPVYDSLGGTHPLTFSFTKRTGASVWDWRAFLAQDEEFLAGETGTVYFDGRGSLVSFQFTDGFGRLAFRPQASGVMGAEVVSLGIDPGTLGGVNGLTQFASWTDLTAVSDGNPPQPKAHLYDLRLSVPGRMAFNALMRFGDVPNGTLGSARHGLLAPATADHRIADLRTELALDLDPTGSPVLDLRYRATVGGVSREAPLLSVERGSTPLSALLSALRTQVGAPEPGASALDPEGHIVVFGVGGAEGALSQLQVFDAAQPNGLLSLSLRFATVAPGDSGCH